MYTQTDTQRVKLIFVGISMIDRNTITMYSLNEYLTEYKELNTDNKYRPVAVGRYGIRDRESIYSKDLAKDYSKNKLIHRGTLTVGMGSVQMDIGILSEDITYSVSPAYHTYRINGIDYDYLRYCLQCRNLDMFTRYMKRGSRQGKSIDLHRWIGYEIPVYPQNTQLEIVDRLNRVQSIVDLRKRELEEFNGLIKARFVEMFGTLERPARNFTRDNLKNLCNKITDGKHGGCTQEDGTGRYFVGAREIYDDTVHYDTAPQINIGEFEKDYKRCNVEKGDFLIVNTGATIGKSAIAIDERTEHTLLQKSVALLKTKRSVLHPVFLKFCYIVNDKMYTVESASAQPNLLLSKIKATEIYVPPMTLQEEFVTFVTQVDKSKATVQKSLDETQLLFDSLMQEYFG